VIVNRPEGRLAELTPPHVNGLRPVPLVTVQVERRVPVPTNCVFEGTR